MEQLTLHQNTDTAHPQDVVPIYFFHTLEHPFCPLPRYWCHANQQERGKLLEESKHGLLITREAANFAHGKTANHHSGDQAQQVHVTVTKHCLAPAYTLSGVWQQVTRARAKSIPSSYRLVRVTILLLTATVTDGKRGAGTLSLHITASLAFVPAGNRNSHGSGK